MTAGSPAGERSGSPEFRLSFLEGRNLPETALPRGEFFDQITESALDLLFSLLLAPCTKSREGKRLLRSDFVSKEKKNLLAALRAERNDREAYAKRRCTELLCAGEPYAGSDLGEEKAVRAANAGTLTAYYQSLLRSQPLEIYYTGSEPMDALCAYLRRSCPLFCPAAGPLSPRSLFQTAAGDVACRGG